MLNQIVLPKLMIKKQIHAGMYDPSETTRIAPVVDMVEVTRKRSEDIL